MWQNWDGIQEVVSLNPKRGNPLRITTVALKGDFIWHLFEQLNMSPGLADGSIIPDLLDMSLKKIASKGKHNLVFRFSSSFQFSLVFVVYF